MRTEINVDFAVFPGMERHERCATVPDLIARVVPGKEEDVLWVDRTSRLFCSAGVFAFNEPISG